MKWRAGERCTQTMRRRGSGGSGYGAGAGLWLERVQFSNFTYRVRQTPNRPSGQRLLHNYCPHCPPPMIVSGRSLLCDISLCQLAAVD